MSSCSLYIQIQATSHFDNLGMENASSEPVLIYASIIEGDEEENKKTISEVLLLHKRSYKQNGNGDITEDTVPALSFSSSNFSEGF